MKFNMEIAGLTFEIQCQHEYMKLYCKDYIVANGDSDYCISVSQQDIDNERSEEDPVFYDEDYLETVASLRKIGELLPAENCVLCHGAVITYDIHDAFLFTAPSGTGKTTHIRLWRKFLKNGVGIVNGDKPVLKIEDGYVESYGSPWAGKEGWQKNCHARLKGICFVNQGLENSIRKINPIECLGMMFSQIYMPVGEEALDATLKLMERILEYVPVYVLMCDISEEAVKTSFEMMTGLNYEEEKKRYED